MVGRCMVRAAIRRVFPDAVVIITYPLLTTATCQGLKTGVGTVSVRQGDLVRAEGHTAHHPIHTVALVLTAGLEILSVLIHVTSELTWTSLCISLKMQPTTVILIIVLNIDLDIIIMDKKYCFIVSYSFNYHVCQDFHNKLYYI